MGALRLDQQGSKWLPLRLDQQGSKWVPLRPDQQGSKWVPLRLDQQGSKWLPLRLDQQGSKWVQRDCSAANFDRAELACTVSIVTDFIYQTLNGTVGLFVGGLLNVPATLCISGADQQRQFYVLPHWDRSCRSNFLPSHSILAPGWPVPVLTL